MQTRLHTLSRPPQAARRKLNRETVSLVGDLLPICDFAAVLLAAWLATLAFTSGGGGVVAWEAVGLMALSGAILAPFILCDRAFVSFASSGQGAAMVRCYLVRFAIFAAVVAGAGATSLALAGLPVVWLALWGGLILLSTALIRVALVSNLRRLEREGVLSEVVAIVGSGAAADAVVARLQRRAAGRVRIIGTFSDQAETEGPLPSQPRHSIADLLELGKSEPIDWILLAPPTPDPISQHALIVRLKALAAPIAVCTAADTAAPSPLASAGQSLAVIMPDRQWLDGGWHSTRAALSTVVPGWIATVLLDWPRAGARAWAAGRHPSAGVPFRPNLTLTLDNHDLPGFVKVAAGFGQQRYGYVVTPNADHLARLDRDATFRSLYAQAAYTVLDSRLIAHWMRLVRGLRLPVCTGSDLTARLFAEVIRPHDPIVLIGGSDRQAAQLRQMYGLTDLHHHNPPMGFIRQPLAVEACLRFVEARSPFRYCLLAVGAPQQEMLAQQLRERGTARGLALCIGASINFLTGDERRAPRWMQQVGMEWLFRLICAPRRLAGRYLLRGPQLLGLLRRTQIVLRDPLTPLVQQSPVALPISGFRPAAAVASVANESVELVAAAVA